MEKKYNKLVRDKIPEIIEEDGKSCNLHIADKEEYEVALGKKLVEEANELASAEGKEDKIRESADLLEVLLTIWREEDITLDEVLTEKEKKIESRGGFSKKIILEDVND